MRYAKSLQLWPCIFSAYEAGAVGMRTKQKRLLGKKQALKKSSFQFNRGAVSQR